jgi:hypothetical protein
MRIDVVIRITPILPLPHDVGERPQVVEMYLATVQVLPIVRRKTLAGANFVADIGKTGIAIGHSVGSFQSCNCMIEVFQPFKRYHSRSAIWISVNLLGRSFADLMVQSGCGK